MLPVPRGSVLRMRPISGVSEEEILRNWGRTAMAVPLHWFAGGGGVAFNIFVSRALRWVLPCSLD